MGMSPWSRCEYCRWIRKYVEKESCPNYKKVEKPVDTVTEND
jgi:hypothetical protein